MNKRFVAASFLLLTISTSVLQPQAAHAGGFRVIQKATKVFKKFKILERVDKAAETIGTACVIFEVTDSKNKCFSRFRK